MVGCRDEQAHGKPDRQTADCHICTEVLPAEGWPDPSDRTGDGQPKPGEQCLLERKGQWLPTSFCRKPVDGKDGSVDHRREQQEGSMKNQI